MKKILLVLLFTTAAVTAWFIYEIGQDRPAPPLSESVPAHAGKGESETPGKLSDEEEWFAEVTELTKVRLDVSNSSVKRARERHETMQKHRFNTYRPPSWHVDERSPYVENQ